MVNVVSSMVPVIFFVLFSVSSQSTKIPHTCTERCNLCMFRNREASPPPELLWVTSRVAVLRARLACSECCLKHISWNSRVKGEALRNNHSPLDYPKCKGKEFCDFEELPGTEITVYNSFPSDENSSTNGPGTLVKLCPKTPPPEPKEVTCLLHEDMIHLSWHHEREECQSYAQYMIQTRTNGKIGPWKWLGEVAPSGLDVPGYNVMQCPDRPYLFCTSFTNAFSDIQLKLGVRRMDTNLLDQSIAKTDFIYCSGTKNSSQITINFSESLTSSAVTIMPHTKHCLSLKCSKAWSTVAIILSGVLVILSVLLPLAFCAGMRWQKVRSRCSSCTTWQHMNDNQFPWNNTLGREDLIGSEAPPGYTYDYTYSGLQRNQSPPPGQRQFPPTMPLPPRPRGESVEIQNNMYVSDGTYEPRSHRGKQITSGNART